MENDEYYREALDQVKDDSPERSSSKKSTNKGVEKRKYKKNKNK